ncbi:GIY-YIG nuclease family protein [Catenovulum sp. 2E275]|uniref:GIY-YIG nuclease family protein n=1 Tax=Catenovulum sp. 2E275 TaxID=2980497 RepID=UPI0021D18E33|nr:GIY-YIG nuclease family protein [Catenovulum sp. 2E275]MCU4677323.1 GIY-YIG nuclease family protein [Catenovulum sp. 2E275]
MVTKQPCIYILTNKKDGTLYIGVTSDLVKRVWQHKQKLVTGFSNKYNTDKLVYFEMLDDIYQAITREKQIKKWNRSWKINLIQKQNPDWIDLWDLIK